MKNNLIAIFVSVFASTIVLSSCLPKEAEASKVEPVKPTEIVSKPTIIGEWERFGSFEGRKINEKLVFNEDGTYLLEAKYEDANDVLASENGTFTYTNETVTFVDSRNNKRTQSYSLDVSGKKLILSNKKDDAWSRTK
jgi:hypothetical protein